MIKKTSDKDFELLFILEKECFPSESWNLAQITSHHQNQKSLLYFSENSETPVGYILYLENSFEIEILRIGVKENSRHLGIASYILDHLENNFNSKQIILEVKSENIPAISLYKKKGFINIAVRKRYYADGSDAIIMKKGK